MSLFIRLRCILPLLVSLAGAIDACAQNPAPAAFPDTPEIKLGGYKDKRLWESCMTLITAPRGGWSYRKDGVAKSSAESIRMLVSRATGDGNLLLVVRPHAAEMISIAAVKP